MSESGRKGKAPDWSPDMSTTSILVSVEDLIHMAMGPENVNVVNFKLLQTVLHILARQMRLLEQRVEVKISDYITRKTDDDKEEEERGWSARDRSVSIDERGGRPGEKDAARAEREAAKPGKDAVQAAKEATKSEKEAAKASAKAGKETTKAEKEAQRTAEREKKDKEKSLAAETKEKQKQEKAGAKGGKATEKDKAAAERAASKEREKEGKAGAKTSKEEEQERAASKGRPGSASKGQDRDKSKERDEADKAGAKGAGGKGGKAGAKGGRDASKEDEESEEERERASAGPGKGGKAGIGGKAGAKDEKDMTEAEKAAAKEQERAERAGGKGGRGRTPGAKGAGSDTSIVITEAERDKQKVLVVEKGPTTRSGGGGGPGGPGGAIEVVTRSQFDLLKELVSDLSEKAGPLPMPSLPKNKELLQQLSKGTASLTDMMGALQVNARVKAAEQAIGRMGGILTELAVAGALPEDIAGQVGVVTSELNSELREAGGGGSGGGGSSASRASRMGRVGGAGGGADDEDAEEARMSKSAASAASRKSILAARSKYAASGTGPASTRPSTVSASGSSVYLAKVTHPELDDAVRTLKEDMMKSMQQITGNAAMAAETAVAMVKGVAEKLDIAMNLNGRITTLYSQVNDYAEQLSGFDAGLSTQMQGFSEQMTQMRSDLKQGLNLLESVNNNAETAAVLELKERYEGLVTELDHTLHFHQGLTLHQGQLGEDLSGLIAAVETLREQKADRDEVQDGLRDKADNSRLAGLLTEEEFARSRTELERRLAVCHDKFSRQDEVWMQAIKELKTMTEVKADLIQLLGLRDEAQESLQMLHQMCQNLALVLGEPKAAVLTRKLTRGAVCAACLAPALMEPEDKCAGAPPPLPAARPRPTGAPAVYEEPCEKEFKLPEPPDAREHICNRWVGGSHTLVAPGVVTRAHAQPMTYDAIPTNKFTGYGQDGRLYMMEEELQPCIECNKLSEEADEAGGGDMPANTLPPIDGKV